MTVKKQVLELPSALCVYNAEGYNRALDALEHYRVLKGERYRLNVIVSELRTAATVDYQTALVAFINCIIISTPQLKERIRIRNEFIGKSLYFHFTTSVRAKKSSFQRKYFVAYVFVLSQPSLKMFCNKVNPDFLKSKFNFDYDKEIHGPARSNAS